MTRDPLYQQIIAGLSGKLDPDAFERCAADLLRAAYPGLVPVRGGSDGGMDGACPDGAGEAYPLVTTTEQNVVGNLKRSLRSYKKEGGTRDKVIAATSRELTAKRRRNLETEAKKLGFTLVNVHTQASMADLLYRCPAWCRELLNLSGDPPPLSALPDSPRPALTSALVGRDDDLAWLRQTPGDLLVVGQPGSGKTALLSALARAGEGLFVVTDDPGRIADGVRSQQPGVLLVDDAHLRCDLLARLGRWRRETGAPFRVIADCWPGGQEAVTKALGITTSSVRTLDPLIRKQVVEVINACGVDGPNALLHELVRQADGRPGLAVTLCHLWLREGGRGIALAEALCADVRTTFGSLVGPEAVRVLAAFAVGGEWGMPLAAVARELGESPLRINTVAAGLAAGGVLTEAGGDSRLAVRPEPLRHALVRDVFFNETARLPIDGLVAEAHPEGAARTLIGARGRGGRVGPERLTGMLAAHDHGGETWQAFASLGPEESRWALRERPEWLLAVTPVALHHAPEETVPMLLAAEADGPAGPVANPGR
jgi:hypothetical protein